MGEKKGGSERDTHTTLYMYSTCTCKYTHVYFNTKYTVCTFDGDLLLEFV